ncbi:sensor histidine kinase [Tropicibacter oceani]|uniref:histidine kinase n=1 Tax=Tropicibacter oceani TaxID=3058420 RepID=A0ABY8QF75_9RHOB|nr:ATP-binding protein [Tropicibacter oceani]WGW02442.1 ATP-binding protein [Tropicibacter oceani]
MTDKAARPSLFARLFRPRSLSSRLVMITLTVTFCTMSMMALLSYVSIRDSAHDAAMARLAAVSQRAADRISSNLAQTERDAAIISQLPQLAGILRASLSPDGLDSKDGSTMAQWSRRLERTFASIIGTRPQYTQLRLISRDNDWQELVRVNQLADGRITIVPGDRLQQKAGEPYLADSARLASEEGFFSRVTKNREHGVVVGRPTIRFIQPVKHPDGSLFGVIVINADFESLISLGHVQATPDVTVGIVTASLDHKTLSGAPSATGLAFHDDANFQPPAIAPLLQDSANFGKIVFHGENANLIKQIITPTAYRPLGLYTVTHIPKSVLLSAGINVLIQVGVIGVILTVLGAIVAGAAGKQAIRPLDQLLDAIRSRKSLDATITFPKGRQDEVSELGRAFVAMANELVAESQRTRAILDGTADGMIVSRPDGTIIDVNPAVETLFGYTPQELLGRNITCLMESHIGRKHSGFVDASLADARPKPMAGQRDIAGVAKSGARIPLEISVSRLGQGADSIIIGSLRDVSERKAADKRVNDLIASLERSNSELDKFAYVASHDLRAPLRVIDNASKWLEEDLEPVLTDDTRESLQLLRSRVARMERLLDDLLQHSRIGRVDQVSDEVSGTELVQHIRDLINLPDTMTLNFNDDFEGIEVRKMPLATVLLNLISNAIKHNDKPHGQVDVSVVPLPAGLEFRITDDGPGIAKEYHKRIFDMFQTLKPRDHVDGSGMGLAMVKKYVELAEGEIDVESDGQNGTTFVLFWPHDAQMPEPRTAVA